MTKSQVRDMLRDGIIRIRELAQSTSWVSQLAEIYALSDTIHNIPTLLSEWDELDSREPGKRDFLLGYLDIGLKEYMMKYPDSASRFSK